MKKLFLILFLVTVVLNSCKKDIPEDTLTVAELARDYLYDGMNEVYLWYKLMPVVVKEDYKDPYELMDAMRYKALDRWSFVQTYDEFLAYYQGSFVGHGIRMA
jgi:carboxyl-terminal processing protease